MSNGIVKIIRYFQSNENSVSFTEFSTFWQSMTEEERNYYREVNLETGLLPE